MTNASRPSNELAVESTGEDGAYMDVDSDIDGDGAEMVDIGPNNARLEKTHLATSADTIVCYATNQSQH